MKEILDTTSKNVDWRLVRGFKKGLKDLEKGNIEEFKKGTLTD